MNNLINKWRELVNHLNKMGIPLPVLRDPKSGAGSVSLTLVFISFNFWLIGAIGKTAKLLGNVDLQSAFNMFLACAALYWGRKLTNDKSSVE